MPISGGGGPPGGGGGGSPGYVESLGRISGPLLAANLRRNEDLAFKDTELSDPVLFLNIGARQIGINTDSTNNALTVLGKTLTTGLAVDTHLETPNFYISTNRIQNLVSAITIEPDQTTDPTVKGPRFDTVNFKFTTNAVENITNNSDINLNPNGYGRVVFTTTQVNIDGDLHATGDITFDGSITFGNNNLDSLTFSADIASHIVPDLNETYDLGTSLKRWNSLYSKNILATSATISDNLTVNNINLSTLINKTLYVSVNGNDGNIGTHDHATYRTVKYALSQAVAGDNISIFPGEYVEIFPLTVPQGVSVTGIGIRAVTIKPTAETDTNDCFLLNGETTVSNLSIKDFYSPGYGFKFATGCIVTSRSPYVQNVSVITSEIPGSTTPTNITVGPAPTGISLTSNSVTLSKTFYSQTLVDSLVGQTAVIDRYPAAPLFYTVVSIATEPLSPTEWRMTVDTAFNSAGQLRPISFYPDAGTALVFSNDIWDTTGNSVGEKWVAWYKTNLPIDFTATVGPGWTINLIGTLYIVDYIIEDPGNTNMWRIYVTTSLVAGTGIPIFSSPIVSNTILAGSGALVDGSVVNEFSNEASMLFHSVTFIVPGSIGLHATNGSRVEWLNSFTYFAEKGLYLTQGTVGFYRIYTAFSVLTLTEDGRIILAEDGVPFFTEGPASGYEYGAELRSIGSANVYGTYGVVADGADTLGYLIGHNFGYIGSGIVSTNDPSQAIQAFEVVESNNGRIYYDSVDHKGDFRVGDVFYVNQETGAIAFNAQSITFNPLGAISVEGGTSPSYVDRNIVQTGNIRIYDNNIDSLLGPVNFLASSGSTYLNTNVFVTGNTTVSSNINVDGNLFLGNQSTDTITVFSNLTQDLVPDDAGGPFFLGTDTTRWNTLFATLLNVDNVTQISSNTISTLTTNTSLILSAAGTGKVQVTNTDVQVNNSLTVVGTTTINGATSLKNTVIGTTILSGAVGSAQFSGSNYLTVPNNVALNPGTGNFTIEFWIYLNSATANASLYRGQSGGADIFLNGSSKLSFGQAGISTLIVDSVNMTTGAWVHVAAVKNGGSITLYKNGAVVGSTGSAPNFVTSTITYIGSNGTWYVNGRITNTRVVIGSAVYTGVFTPPTSPLTAIAGTQLLLLEDTGANLLKDSSTNNFTVTNVGSVTWSALSPVAGSPGGTIPNDLTLIGNINQTGNTYITGLFANNNISITGSSYFSVPDIKLQNSEVSVTATDSDLTLTGATTGGVVLDQRLKINGSTISNVWSSPTTDTQRSVILQPNGTGNVTILGTNAAKIPAGNTTTRTIAAGEIRYNDVTNLYEGGAGTGLISFNGLYDSDRNTYITTGPTDNTIYFGINNVVNTTLNSTSLNSNIFEAGNVRLTGNTLSNKVSGNDLTFSPDGIGNTVLNGLPISQNYIVNSLNTSLNLNTSGTGYIKFSGTGGLVVPKGNDGSRRGTPELGELRYNTQALGVLEIFDGVQWMSAVGNNATVSEADVLDVLELWTLILG